MAIEIRRATSEDFNLYKQMYTELCETQEPKEYGELVSSSVLIRDKVSAWLTEDDIYHPYILFKDEEPIGIALIHLRTERAVIEMWHVGIMYIRKECRRQGYGEKLLRTLIEKYSIDNLDFTINVYAWNEAAIKLYEKVGFKPRSVMMKLPNAKEDT